LAINAALAAIKTGAIEMEVVEEGYGCGCGYGEKEVNNAVKRNW